MDNKMEKKEATKLIIGLVIVIAAIVAALFAYNNSVKDDFNNISHAEIYRMGDDFTGLYHRPDCPKIKKVMKPIYFEDGKTAKENNEAAKHEGYKPCPRCTPDKD